VVRWAENVLKNGVEHRPDLRRWGMLGGKPRSDRGKKLAARVRRLLSRKEIIELAHHGAASFWVSGGAFAQRSSASETVHQPL
jgi:hypothetical protein